MARGDRQYVETRNCNECGEQGHLRRDCPTLDEEPRYGYTVFDDELADEPVDEPLYGYTVFSIRAAVILDTGANTSRFANRRLTRYI